MDDWEYPHDYGNLYMMDVKKNDGFLWRLMFGSSNSGDCDGMTELWYGGFPFVMGYPQITQIIQSSWMTMTSYWNLWWRLGIPNFRTPPYVWKLELEVEVGDLEPWKMWIKSAVTEGKHRLSAEGPCPRKGESFYRITSKNRQHDGDVTSPKVYLEIEDKHYEFLWNIWKSVLNLPSVIP